MQITDILQPTGGHRSIPLGGQGVGLGGLASMLDLDRDGNPLDIIIGMVTKRGR